MPQRGKSFRSNKAKANNAKAVTVIAARYRGRAAQQFATSKDDDYVNTGSSISDTEAGQEVDDVTSQGINHLLKHYIAGLINCTASRSYASAKRCCFWKIHSAGIPPKPSTQVLISGRHVSGHFCRCSYGRFRQYRIAKRESSVVQYI